MFTLWYYFSIQKEKGNNVQSFLREQIGVDISQGWNSIDPADIDLIPRVSTNIPNRVNRLKAIGNGQVPQTVKLVWEILTR
jgi:hypothetical protein